MKTAVFILRAQPVHDAHIHLIRQGLKGHDNVLCVLGSYNTPRYVLNPWTVPERMEFIKGALREDERKRVTFVAQRDFMYSNVTWMTNVQNNVRMKAPDSEISLIGHFKDVSSEYLRYFPQWNLIEEPNYKGINGTDIRNALYEDNDVSTIVGSVPANVSSMLDEWIKTNEFARLQSEYNYIKEYRAQFEGYPYPPTFQTADTVVVQSGHVLLIRRKINPGKDMIAIPGGFVGQDEFIIDTAVRELKEETQIVSSTGRCLTREDHKDNIENIHVFDHPRRSLRGRIITTAHLIRLRGTGPLPTVKGADDASEAFWMPLADLRLHEAEFFEDHLHIVEYFCNKL